MVTQAGTNVSSVIDELRWRGMIYDLTEGVEDALRQEKLVAYNGFDATGPSLHVGHLIPIMGLVHLQRYGHTPIALVGGGTSLIGDPSGKSKERVLLSAEEIEANAASIRQQLARFLDFETKDNPARLINNADWLRKLSLIEFLRDTGKHFTVNQMLAKESVKQRMEKEEGISFTEFSYMLLQAHDFHVLYQEYGCTLQTGGSDQWGNITAGTELVRRLGGKAHALVYPLLTNASGEKFGKTATITGMDSVWLDAEKTSPYKFYQFWLNTDDRDVMRHLKVFTLLTQDEIAELEDALQRSPERREAQQRLAEEITRLVHGEAGLQKAQQASHVLFSGNLEGLSADDLLNVFADVPAGEISRAQLEASGVPLVDLVAAAGFEPSKSRARTLIGGGGVSLNGRKITEANATVGLDDVIGGKVMILRKGKKDTYLVRVV